MQKQSKEPASGMDRKRKLSVDVTHSEPKKAAIKPSSPSKPTSPLKKKKIPTPTMKKVDLKISSKTKTLKKKKKVINITATKEVKDNDEIGDISSLINKELIQRFRSVPFSNNQKGRIRQAIRSQLVDSDNNISKDLIYGKIKAILKSAENLTDSDLRRIRILYNMYTSSDSVPSIEKKSEPKKEAKVKKEDGDNKKETGEKSPKKKGPKRYVVFIGNLPSNITKEMVMQHFDEISNNIKDIRLPKQVETDDKKVKSAFAFMEVSNQSSYEVALSKHHSMLGNKRINVSFTLQENSKLTKSEAKGKAAKLVALQKAGKLAGSTALVKKRSHRRNILKRARAQEAAKENA